jgi:hypothetical protein
VVSKPITNGLLVTSGLWLFAQDATLRKSLAWPMLGLNQGAGTGSTQQLRPLLSVIRGAAAADSVNSVLLFSNADSVMSANDVDAWVQGYVSGYGGRRPVIHTINLVDGASYTGSIVVNGVEYPGSGYLLQGVAEVMGGMHFETRERDWTYITENLAYSPFDRMDTLRIVVSPDGTPGALREWWEIAPESGNYRKPRFFMGVSGPAQSTTFDVFARFLKTPGEIHRVATAYANADTTPHVLATMMGWEKLKQKLLTSSTDTAGIVRSAMTFNLLCDYTSLICLEPDSLHHPLVNPLDESGFTTAVTDERATADSLVCGAYPNPFNGQTTIRVSVPRASDVTITIFNMLGQRIRESTREGVSGVLTSVWSGTSERGTAVASGVYFVRVSIKELANGHQNTRMLRLLFLK